MVRLEPSTPDRLPPAGAGPGEIVAWAVERYGDGLVLACSFSLDDAVLVEMWSRVGQPRVFAIDTGRLPEETFRAAESLAARFGLTVEWYCPRAEAVESLLRAKGAYSFYDSLEARRECCGVRKVEPLKRALAGRKAWLTGLRRDQGVTRQAVEPVTWDAEHGLAKISPLAAWTREQVADYAREHGVPAHPLYRRGYTSIGCAPCTRAVAEGEDGRAGRWWWESPEHRECGLHPAAAEETR